MSPRNGYLVVTILILSAMAGCGKRQDAPSAATGPTPSSYAARLERVAYSGSPPVIPHPPLSGKCGTCHTAAGTRLPGLGAAPANPHLMTAGMSTESRCRQCHVFQSTNELFVNADFEPFKRMKAAGERAQPNAPPTIPHALFMRESCSACHTGPAARPEIRCTHPDRTRCQQCHVPEHNHANVTAVAPEFTPGTSLSKATNR